MAGAGGRGRCRHWPGTVPGIVQLPPPVALRAGAARHLRLAAEVRVGPADRLVADGPGLAAHAGDADQHAEIAGGGARDQPSRGRPSGWSLLLLVACAVIGEVRARVVERPRGAHVDRAGGAAFEHARRVGLLLTVSWVNSSVGKQVEVDLAVGVLRVGAAGRGDRDRRAVEQDAGEVGAEAADGDVEAFAGGFAADGDAGDAVERSRRGWCRGSRRYRRRRPISEKPILSRLALAALRREARMPVTTMSLSSRGRGGGRLSGGGLRGARRRGRRWSRPTRVFGRCGGGEAGGEGAGGQDGGAAQPAEPPQAGASIDSSFRSSPRRPRARFRADPGPIRFFQMLDLAAMVALPFL